MRCAFCGRAITFVPSMNRWRHDSTGFLKCHLPSVNEFASPVEPPEGTDAA